MARPPLPAGTHGHIRFQRTAAGDAWRARTQVRDWDGRTRPVERTGRTKAAAKDRLEIAVRDRVHADAPGDITPDTRITSVAEAWFTRVTGEGKAATTLEKYRRILDRYIIPRVGGLRVRELSVGRCDHFQESVSAKHGPGTAKLTRTVLSGVCALACRHGALPHNPMRDVSAIRTGAKAATALTELEARQVRAYLTYDDRSVRRDIPDFVDIMLATSLRISECAAIHWPDLDLATCSLRVRGNVVRLTGKGLVVNEYESNKLTRRTLRLPSWAIDMLRRRRSTMPGDGPVFPAPTGGLRDPSNTQADLRDAFTFAGRPSLTSHVFRKTVATLMDTRGRTARNVSDQLGHSQTAMAQNKYMGRQITDTGAADILEALAF